MVNFSNYSELVEPRNFDKFAIRNFIALDAEVPNLDITVNSQFCSIRTSQFQNFISPHQLIKFDLVKAL